MNFWADYYMQNEQSKDRRREAAAYREISWARSARRDRTTRYCQMVASFGRRLVHWGRRLEAQYGA